MAVLLGSSIGSLIAMLVVCLLIYKFGPHGRVINFLLQAIVSGLITVYLSTNHYGIHYRSVDVAANWIGWGGALVVMLITMLRARSKVSAVNNSPQEREP